MDLYESVKIKRPASKFSVFSYTGIEKKGQQRNKTTTAKDNAEKN